jgi:hypothetical protein
VCFAGAAVIAAWEHLAYESNEPLYANPVIELLTDHADELGIKVTRANLDRWGGGPVATLTQAMIDGRAGEVCDRALAALEVTS